MSEEDVTTVPGPQQGLMTSLRTLAATFITVMGTRLEILGIELEEERLRLAKIAVWSSLALFFAGLSLIFLSLLVVVANWEAHRIAAFVGIVLFYAVLAIGAGCLLARELSKKSQLFSGSLEELRKDRLGLQPVPIPEVGAA